MERIEKKTKVKGEKNNMAANVETMFSVREKPWHGLGVVVEEAPSSEDALRLAGLDWRVVQKSLYTNSGLVDGYKANVRESDNTVLGVVTDRYKVVQNTEAFAFTDNLLGEGVKYETAGSLQGGKKVWILARLPREYIMSGERITPYLVFSNTHDGSGAVKVAITPVRVVCNNTLNLALSTANRCFSMVHTGDIKGKIDEAKQTLFMADEYMEALGNEFERSYDDIESFIRDENDRYLQLRERRELIYQERLNKNGNILSIAYRIFWQFCLDNGWKDMPFDEDSFDRLMENLIYEQIESLELDGKESRDYVAELYFRVYSALDMDERCTKNPQNTGWRQELYYDEEKNLVYIPRATLEDYLSEIQAPISVFCAINEFEVLGLLEMDNSKKRVRTKKCASRRCYVINYLKWSQYVKEVVESER